MRKGQEEIVGFVMIMVIVAVIFLIFIGLNIKPSSEIRDSREISQFLESSMEFTTDCAISYSPDYSKLGELFGNCFSSQTCLNGKKSCEVLETTMKSIVEESWKVGSERPIKAYNFDSVYRENNVSVEKKIISFSEGNCTSNVYGSDYLIRASPGSIIAKFEVCY